MIFGIRLSSIVKKQIMALSGFALCGFLLAHLLGNCLIYLGPETFNSYAHALISNPFLIVAEIILLLIFLCHVFIAICLTVENYNARDQKYFMTKHTGRGATFSSSTMPYTGLIILIFVITHLINFKYGSIYYVEYSGVSVRDLYRLVIEFFQDIKMVVFYIFCMLCLGFHLKHGFASAFQSLGINHPKYNGMIKCSSVVFSFVIMIGYSALPIYCYFQRGY